MQVSIQFILIVSLSLENARVISQTSFPFGNETNSEEQTTTTNQFLNILQDENSIYVDKTLLLEDVFDLMYDNYILVITAPKRFGKSVNLHMIQKFCEIEVFDNGTSLANDPNNITDTPNYRIFTKKYSFGHLKIAQKKEFIRQHLGKYPVAYFDFQPCENEVTDIKSAINCYDKVIQKAFLSHKYLLNSTRLEEYRKSTVEIWISDERRLDFFLEQGIKNLMGVLWRHYGKEIILLVDGHDWFINGVMKNTLPKNISELEDIMDAYEGMFLIALKDSAILRVAVLTGILRVSNEKFFNALPKVKTLYFGQNEKFSQHYGFTSEEITELLQRSGNNAENLSVDKIQEYYNGYKVFEETMYCPYSIVRCLKNKAIEAYWANTDSIEYLWPSLRLIKLRCLILDLYNRKSLDVKFDKILQVWGTSLLDCIGVKEIRFGNKIEISEFLAFLLAAGYLRIDSAYTDTTYMTDLNFKVTSANEETRSDLGRLLTKYKSMTANDKETLLVVKITKLLTAVGYDNFETSVQKITNELDRLGKLILPKTSTYPEENNLKDMIRFICSHLDLNYSSEAKVNIGYKDFILLNIPGSLVVIEVKYDTFICHTSTSQTVLKRIETHVGDILASEYLCDKTPPYNVVMLGIHLTSKESKIYPYITISAKIVSVINLDKFGESITVHCKPMGTLDGDRPTIAHHVADLHNSPSFYSTINFPKKPRKP